MISEEFSEKNRKKSLIMCLEQNLYLYTPAVVFSNPFKKY